jgi:hypothetical protein
VTRHLHLRVGINAGFGSPIAHEFADLKAYGFAVVRQDLFAVDPAQAPALVTEFVGAPVTPLFLIGGGHIQHPDGLARLEPHELAAWTTTVVQTAQAAGLTEYAIEIGNEPDIAHPGYSEHPEDFAEAVRQCHEAARGNGFTGAIVIGGIANLNDRGFDYLERVLDVAALPLDDLVVGFHRYPETGHGPLKPHDRFGSRQDEWRAFRAIVGHCRCACTEFGYHTAPARPFTLSDQDVAGAVDWDLDFYEEGLVHLACLYQLNDGPGDSYLDRYGVRTLDGTWKPVAVVVENWEPSF